MLEEHQEINMVKAISVALKTAVEESAQFYANILTDKNLSIILKKIINYNISHVEK